MRLIFCAAAVAWALAGCASGVNLNDVPVEDRSSVANADVAGVDAKSGSVSAVAPVAALGSDSTAWVSSEGKLVYFDFDSFAIKPEFQGVIESNARFLLADRKRRLVIEGHTDDRGGREYNLALGQKRAQAVLQALNLLGVDEAQVEAVSFGKEKPAASGNDDAAMAKNRRAELRIR